MQQVHKAKCRNARNMKKEGNIQLPKIHNLPLIDSKDNDVNETPDKEFKRTIIKIIIQFKRT